MDTKQKPISNIIGISLAILVLQAVFGHPHPAQAQVQEAWIFVVVVLVIAIGASYALMPEPPKTPEPSPAAPDEFDAPQAKEGEDIVVVFGLCRMKQPNVVWYGNIRSKRIKEKV